MHLYIVASASKIQMWHLHVRMGATNSVLEKPTPIAYM